MEELREDSKESMARAIKCGEMTITRGNWRIERFFSRRGKERNRLEKRALVKIRSEIGKKTIIFEGEKKS